MSFRRSIRLLPDPSQIIVIAGAVILLLALVGFADLAVEKSAALAANERARAQLGQLEDQERMLLNALDLAHEGQNVAPRAHEYFNWVAEGVTVIVPQPEPEIPAPEPEQWELREPDFSREWRVRAERSFADGVEALDEMLQSLVAHVEQLPQP